MSPRPATPPTWTRPGSLKQVSRKPRSDDIRRRRLARGKEQMGATLGTWLLTWLRGEPVGTDEFGNRYYRLKNRKPQPLGVGRFSHERRWEINNGEPEGSKVPPEWHAWLPHTYDEVPKPRTRSPWEK